MDTFAPGSLLAHLATLADPRHPQGQRFPLVALLAAACAAILCGARSYAAIAQWAHEQDPTLLHRLGFHRHPPTAGAYQYLFSRLDTAAFEEVLRRWIAAVLPTAPEDLRPTPLDGKTVRGSHGPLEGARHLLALLDEPTGGVLRQMPVDAKTNEYKAAPQLLDGLVLEGRLITGDAMFCHRDLAQQILDQGGEYLWAVKDNQPTLVHDLQTAFEPAFSPA
jgi:hypothetical protein